MAKDGKDYSTVYTDASTKLSTQGNYRKIQKEDKHNVMYVHQNWDYLQHGADWGTGCTDGQTNQTPINLVSPGKEGFDYPLIEGVIDKRDYYNQKDVKVEWNGHTSQVGTLGTGISSFTSNLAKEHFGATQGPTTWEAQQFHFHSPSELTFDGKYHDLEMHTVHYPKQDNGYLAAALGIMFSVKSYTAQLTAAERMVIDNFFDTLQWEKDGKPVISNLIAYGDLINIIDFNNRWVYQGSVTTPPCA